MGIKSTGIGVVTSAGDLADSTTTDAIASKIALSLEYQNFLGELAAGVVQALGTAAFVPDKAKAEFFSVAAGAAGTIDTTNTGAYFDSVNKKYYAELRNSSEENAITTPTVTTPSILKEGIKIKTGSVALKLNTVTAFTGTISTAYLCDSGLAVLATTPFSGSVATFSTPPTMAANTVYYILVDYGGLSMPRYYEATTFPLQRTLTQIIAGYDGAGAGDDTTKQWCVDSFNVSTAATTTKRDVLTTSLSSLDGLVEKIALYVYQDSLPTGTSLTFDVDYTGDGNYELTDQTNGAWITLATPETFASAKIRINLNRGTGLETDQPSLKGYCFMTQ